VELLEASGNFRKVRCSDGAITLNRPPAMRVNWKPRAELVSTDRLV
jgi:hypothetical protein